MNKPFKPSMNSAAELLSAAMRATVLSYLNDPASAEQKITDRSRQRYRGDHPEFEFLETKVKDDEARLAILQEDRERHAQAKRGGDLMREKLFGTRNGALTRFDLALFAGIAGVGIGGNFVALTTIATYVSDSGVIERLTDNFWGSTVVSAIPLTGSAVLKAVGAFQPDNNAERQFNLRIAKWACVFVAAHIISLAIFFAPHKLDTAALQQALMDGVAPTNPIVATLQYVASYLVLGTGLFAEMLIAPVVLNCAHKLHRAGREVITTLHDEQKAHDQIIAEINAKIDPIVVRLGKDRAKIEKHTSALAEMIEATLHLYRETVADLKAEEKRAKDEFFSKRSKGGL